MKSNSLMYQLSVLDAAVLLWHLYAGAAHKNVGFEDADRTLEELARGLQRRRFPIRKELLESCLWSCNLLDEENSFHHPLDMSFDAFVEQILSPTGAKLDKFYHWIEDPRGEKRG